MHLTIPSLFKHQQMGDWKDKLINLDDSKQQNLLSINS